MAQGRSEGIARTKYDVNPSVMRVARATESLTRRQSGAQTNLGLSNLISIKTGGAMGNGAISETVMLRNMNLPQMKLLRAARSSGHQKLEARTSGRRASE